MRNSVDVPCIDIYCPNNRGCEISKEDDSCPYFVGYKSTRTPPLIVKDWRITGSWGTQYRTVQDLEILRALGFDDFGMESRQ